jgi:hypothetical protein
MKIDHSQLQGLLWEALTRALENHTWALAEYRDQMHMGGDRDDLERFRAAVVEPALRECERLRNLTRNNPDSTVEGERLLIEQLEDCHEENLSTSRELAQPSNSYRFEEFAELADKATALQAKCQEIRLALRKYRQERALRQASLDEHEVFSS